MSSNILNAMKNLRQNLHNVGNLNNWSKKVLNQGAVATEKMDNFTVVKLGFNPATEERTATRITATTESGYLVATPEDYMQGYETISSFFNAQGERVRVVALETGVRFECSNVDFETDISAQPLKNGMVGNYDHTTHKFKIWNQTLQGGAGYQTAGTKVILVDKDCTSIDGQTVYRFEVQ